MKQQSSNGFKRILSAVICLFVVTAAWAQRSTVTGTVTDANGDPIIGATVKVANNPSVGTATDFNGNFTFTIDGEQMLEVSYRFQSAEGEIAENSNENCAPGVIANAQRSGCGGLRHSEEG